MTALPIVAILAASVVMVRLFKRDPAWLLRLPMIGAAASIPFFFGLYLAPTWQTGAASFAVAQLLIGTFFGLFLATMQALVWSHERALAAALMMFFVVLIGHGLGPPTIGLLSDLLRPRLGNESLRWALVIGNFLPFWGVFHLWRASRTFRAEVKLDAPAQA